MSEAGWAIWYYVQREDIWRIYMYALDRLDAEQNLRWVRRHTQTADFRIARHYLNFEKASACRLRAGMPTRKPPVEEMGVSLDGYHNGTYISASVYDWADE